MIIEVNVPSLPESVADATILKWHKKEGDFVTRDENLVDLETDKVVLEVPSPCDGKLEEILKAEGDRVNANELLAKINSAMTAAPAFKVSVSAPVSSSQNTQKAELTTATIKLEEKKDIDSSHLNLSPSVRRLVQEHGLNPANIQGTGPGGRLIPEDISSHLQQKQSPTPSVTSSMTVGLSGRPEKRVPMTRLRARVAERLLQAQQSAAMLTTFNEVNLQAVMDLRSRYKEVFEKTHGVKLGFMSFFTKAVVEALKRFPEVNASVDGNDIVYHPYFDIGVAVSTERGLVVPILRNTDQMSMAAIEKQIGEYATRARDGKLSIEEMTGGTFTITNGGTFGSLLSTPILNPPQSGILGMHKIESRPVVENNQIVIRPMMYVALTYDHRLVDGRDSVRFLVTVKEFLEDPSRLLLEV